MSNPLKSGEHMNPKEHARQIVSVLRKKGRRKNIEGMARFGISTHNTLGVTVTDLRKIAKPFGKDHALAIELWNTGIHEARILATIVDDPDMVGEKQMESWIKNFDSWDVCDQACMNLFSRTRLAWEKAIEWSSRKEEFEKRAGFAMMAVLAVHDSRTGNEKFMNLLPIIAKNSNDERNYVKKAVNWALRQIGKRNAMLNREAIRTAGEIMEIDSPAAKWIASDAIRELESSTIRERLSGKR